MAARINTKFVIILACVLVTLTAGAVFAFFSWHKTAEEHVAIAEKALAEAETKLAEGDLEAANALFTRSSNAFGNAKRKDGLNTEHLYRYIETRSRIICDDLTLAKNELDLIVNGGALGIHDTPNASDEDREFLYLMLIDWHRHAPELNSLNALARLNYHTNSRLQTVSDDPIALRYRAVVESFLVSNETDAEDRLEQLQRIETQVAAHPEDPWMHLALARYKLFNAIRQLRANGNAYSEEVTDDFNHTLTSIEQVTALADEAPGALIAAAALLMEVRTNVQEDFPALLAKRVEMAARLKRLLEDKAVRDQLTTGELDRAANIMRQVGVGTQEMPFDGIESAEALARAVLEDRPDEPAPYEILGSLLSRRNAFAEAAAVIDDGLNIKRQTNALQFVRDQYARVEMLWTQADVKLSLAATGQAESAYRDQLLKEAEELISQLDGAQTPNTEQRDARVNLLRGRLALANNRPGEAVGWLNKADQTFDGRNTQALTYLAQSHTLLGNTTRVIELYEQIVRVEPNSPQRINLIRLYLSPRQGNSLSLAEGHLKAFLTRYPNSPIGRRLLANLFAQKDEIDKALEVLSKFDTEKYPEVLDEINRYRRKQGDATGYIESLWQRIADRPEGSKVDLALATQLINAMSTEEEKDAGLAKLVEAGLDAEVARILDKMIRTGEMTLGDERQLIESQAADAVSKAIRLSQMYQRRGMAEEARQALAEAAKLEPNNPVVVESRFAAALENKQWDEASQAIDDLLKLPQDQRPQRAVADGVFMRAQVDAARASVMEPGAERDAMFEQAAAAYRQALDSYPFYSDGWTRLGRIQLFQQNFFAAKNSFTEALSLQDNAVEALELMAQAEIGLGEISLALGRYQQILNINPGYRNAVNRFAALSVQAGQINQAIQIREQLRDRQPKRTDNRRALALLYARAEQYDKAKAEMQAIIEAEGQSLNNARTMGQVLIQSGETDAAIQSIKDYIAGLGTDVQWSDYVILAEAYELAELTEEADTAFEQAIELAGTNVNRASQAWASALLTRGDTERALTLYERLSQADPDNNQLKTQAAELMIRNGQFDKGQALARQLPESPQRYQLIAQAMVSKDPSSTEAISLLRQGAQAFPNHFRLRLQLGRRILSQSSRQAAQAPDTVDFAEAQAFADKLAEDFPEQIDARLLSADVLIAKQANKDAIKALELILATASTHTPTIERLYNLLVFEAQRIAESDPTGSRDRAGQALALVERLIEVRPDSTAHYRRAAAAATLAGQRTVAAQYYGKLHAATGTDRDLTNFALALVEAGQFRDARALLESPDNAGVVANSLPLRALRGRALAGLNESQMALALFQNTLNTNKNNTAATELLLQQAAAAFARQPEVMTQLITNVFGDKRPLAIDLLYSTVLLANERYPEAVAALVAHQNTDKGTPTQRIDLLLRLALAQQESGQLEQAKATYIQATKMVAEDETVVSVTQRLQLLNNLSFLLADQLEGYEDQAVDYARQAVELLPEDSSLQTMALIRDTLGWALYKAGRTSEAIRQLERSISLFPLSANQLHLGKVHLAQGDRDKALLLFDASLRQARAEKDDDTAKEAEAWRSKALQSDGE